MTIPTPEPTPELPAAGGGISDTFASVVRTYLPYLIGLIVSTLGTIGITLPEDAKGALVGVLSFLIGSAWYAAVRNLEKKWPKLGWLLGYPVKPVYSASAATPEDPAVITTVAPVVTPVIEGGDHAK